MIHGQQKTKMITKRKEKEDDANIIMTIQQKIVTLASKEDDHHIDDINNNKKKEIEIGLDFILFHLEEPTIFPRTIMTKKLGYQRKVYSNERALEHFIESDF